MMSKHKVNASYENTLIFYSTLHPMIGDYTYINKKAAF